MTEELKPSSKAVHFEGAKLYLKQDGRGFVLSILIHPNEVPIDLMMSAINTRYTVAMVEMADDGSLVNPRHKSEGERLVASAAMLCENPRFQKWLFKTKRIKHEDQEEAEEYTRQFCGVASRSQLKEKEAARTLFRELRASFQRAVETGEA
jgi:hypothetical protein